MSKTSLYTPCLISLILTTLFLTTITILLLTPPTFLPHIIPPICPSQSLSLPDQTHGRVFNERPELERTVNDSDEVQTWESILLPPGGGGILSHTIPDRIHLTADEKKEEKLLSWGISMFHQLHCLIVLRAIVFPETTENKINSTSQAHSGNMMHDKVHWAHCFDYIAQGILCAADDTIERPRKTKDWRGKTIFDIDGVGAVHQCRDARALWQASVKSIEEPVDMQGWREGVGVRAFLGERKMGNDEEVPELYTLGME
ncbi:uncharacterized protein BO88DRAFT_423112 [Aspergillus vadensis CBS 113365]|uniref:Uncharacterized protein n=1 Tax=Aspergillus vadensis (strain CBS 113365 / IMI 142717 / IBT 24658) TaxID=1448311 RepID=A0A319BMG1_ASPVC|nr:hypothetical protein BO88DRAFT_423112 [Aspergillus vadensis CBS 113365]PYH72280.1 hypothetical protein BO88DRAFT_423112 [Aspergillus vadensis CBS 113365]